jgi:hypothetical protein
MAGFLYRHWQKTITFFMWYNILRFASIFLVVLSLGPGLAHLLELVNKMKLSGREYLIVQQIYRGWSLLGIVIFLSLFTTLGTTIISYRHGNGYKLKLAAFFSLVLSQVLFWTLTYPVNIETKNWTILPSNWMALRDKWEFSHAAGAMFTFCALVFLVKDIAYRR